MDTVLCNLTARDWRGKEDARAIPITESFFMSSRPAFFPAFAAANARSHSFSSARRAADFDATPMCAILERFLFSSILRSSQTEWLQ